MGWTNGDVLVSGDATTSTTIGEDCGDDNGGDPTCEFELTTITYDAAGMWNSENSWTISDVMET